MSFIAALDFCTKTASIWRLVGNILSIFKIVIPLLVIIFGMIDLGKAVIASKDDEIKKAAKQLLMRCIAGVVIFFIPTLVGFVFTLADGFSESDYSVCETCVTNPSACSVKSNNQSTDKK